MATNQQPQAAAGHQPSPRPAMPSERERFLEAVLASSADCIKVLDLDARLVSMNDGGRRVMEISDFNAVQGCPWPDFWRDAGNEAAHEAIAKARAGGVGQFRAKADTFAGNPRWWDVMVTPILGSDGRPERLLSVSRDVTETMRAIERASMLRDELQHRIKNTLSMVQAIVRQTLRGHPGTAVAQRTIDQRLVAMGRAHAMLSGDGWTRSGLHGIIGTALDLHDDQSGRFTVDGPDVALSADAAMSLALVLHELATNAMKYGALSVPGGTVAISWTLAREPGQDDATRLNLIWRERGGPPVVAPTRRGLGSRLIECSLGGAFRGEAVISFATEGVVCAVSGLLEAASG